MSSFIHTLCAQNYSRPSTSPSPDHHLSTGEFKAFARALLPPSSLSLLKHTNKPPTQVNLRHLPVHFYRLPLFLFCHTQTNHQHTQEKQLLLPYYCPISLSLRLLPNKFRTDQKRLLSLPHSKAALSSNLPFCYPFLLALFLKVLCMEELQSDEIQKIQLLRRRLEECNPQSEAIDDGTLRRFLRARSLNVDRALKFLVQHLNWLRTFKPLGFIPESEISNELQKEKIFLQGVDKVGRPIGVILAVRHISSDRNLEEFKRFVVYGFDQAIARLSGGQEKFVLIADLKGYGYKNMDVKGYLAILEILQDHFPERLGKVYLLHVPALFLVAWKIVYPFIDPNVKEKITFVDDNLLVDTLLRDIEIGQLPLEFGGKMELVPIQNVGNTVKSP